MKKSNLFFVLLTALIVMSCSKDETTMGIPQEGNAIEFGTYLGRNPQTRGAELTTTNITNFGIMASYTGTDVFVPASSLMNFMHNQLVTGSGTSWSYTPVKYWPTTKEDKISFFAYAPHSTKTTGGVLSLSANTEAGTPKVTYTVPTDPTKMVDFVAGVVMNRERTVTSGTAADKVDFSLKHELTRVAFQAKVNKDVYKSDGDAHKTKINIKSATFDEGADFFSKADYTFSNSNGTAGSWDNKTVAGVYSIASILNTSPATNLGGYVESGILLSGTSPNVNLLKPAVEATTEPVAAAIPGYLFFIPPNGATGLGSTGTIGDPAYTTKASVTFVYDIVTVDSNLSAGHSVTSATKKVYLPAGTLQQGVAYNYIFTFNVDEVVVTATVDTWGTEQDGTGTVDYVTPDVAP